MLERATKRLCADIQERNYDRGAANPPPNANNVEGHTQTNAGELQSDAERVDELTLESAEKQRSLPLSRYPEEYYSPLAYGCPFITTIYILALKRTF